MNKISEIISTPLISLYESEYLGIIYNVMFDYRQKKLNYACVLNESDNIPRLIKFNDIYKIGKQCIFIKNKTYIDLETNCEKELECCTNPINLKVYNLDGEFIGIANDIIINEKYEIDKLLLNNGKIIESKRIFNISNSLILIDNNQITLNKFKPKQNIIKAKTPDETKVMILSNIKKEEPIASPPTKIITDSRFLVGRILSKDIVAINGEMIAKKDSVITMDTVNKASSYGKLVEIARYSNKKISPVFWGYFFIF